MSDERKVGYYDITWKIENFGMSCRTADVYLIETKTIYLTGNIITKWRFKLDFKKSDRLYYLILFIRMIPPDNQPENRVWTHWKVWVTWNANNMEQEKFIDEFQHVFEFDKPYQCKEIPISQMFFKGFCPFERDVFSIRCLVLFNGTYNGPTNEPTPVAIGLLTLSNDLISMMNSQESFDLRLKNNEMEIGVHKAILYYRNNVLKNMIENNCVDGVIDLQEKGGSDLASIVHYLYSGNFEHFVHEPSFAKLELAKYLKIEEIVNWFVLDEYIIESEYVVVDFIVHWPIKDFSSRTGVISRTFRNNGPMTLPFPITLLIYPDGYDSPDYVSFFVKEMEVPLPPLTYIQVSIGREFLNWIYVQEIFRCVEPDFVFGSDSFVRKESLSRCLVKDTLRLKLHLRAISNSKWVSKVKPTTNLRQGTDVDFYQKLSQDMTRMLDEGKFSDFKINIRNSSWMSHMCVLSVRLRAFAGNSEEINDTIFKEIEPRIFDKFLRYIYSGVLEMGHEELMGLYDLGVKYSMEALVKSSAYRLKKKISDENVSDIFKFAEKNDLASLKKATINFMHVKLGEITDDPTNAKKM